MTAFSDGSQAYVDGATIADCPWLPADPEGLEWRRGFISSEAVGRHAAGTFGASREDYERAGLPAPLRHDMAAFADLCGRLVDQYRVLIADVAEQIRTAMDSPGFRSMVEAARQTDSPGFRSMVEAARHAADSAVTPPVPPSQRHRPCPRHGPTTDTAGVCRPCLRTEARQGRR